MKSRFGQAPFNLLITSLVLGLLNAPSTAFAATKPSPCAPGLKVSLNVERIVTRTRDSAHAGALLTLLQKKNLVRQVGAPVPVTLDLDTLSYEELETILLALHYDSFGNQKESEETRVANYLAAIERSNKTGTTNDVEVSCFDFQKVDLRSISSRNLRKTSDAASKLSIREKISTYATSIQNEAANSDKKNPPNEGAQWGRITADLMTAHPDLIYNSEAKSLFEAFSDGKLQCYSATSLYQLSRLKAELTAPLKSPSLKNLQKRPAFVAFTSGHVQSLIKDEKDQLFSVEHTVVAPNLVSEGKVGERPKPMRILLGKDFLLATAFERYFTPSTQQEIKAQLFCRAGEALKNHAFLFANEALIPSKKNQASGEFTIDPDMFDINESLLGFGDANTVMGDIPMGLTSGGISSGGPSTYRVLTEDDKWAESFEGRWGTLQTKIRAIRDAFAGLSESEKKRQVLGFAKEFEKTLAETTLFDMNGQTHQRTSYTVDLSGLSLAEDQVSTLEWILDSEALQTFFVGGVSSKISFQTKDTGNIALVGVELNGYETREVPLNGLKTSLEELKKVDLNQLKGLADNQQFRYFDKDSRKIFNELKTCFRTGAKPCSNETLASHFMKLGITFKYPDSKNPKSDLSQTFIELRKSWEFAETIRSSGYKNIYCVKSLTAFAREHTHEVEDPQNLVLQMNENGICDAHTLAQLETRGGVRVSYQILRRAYEVGLSELLDMNVSLRDEPEVLGALLSGGPARDCPPGKDCSTTTLDFYRMFTHRMTKEERTQAIAEIKRNAPFDRLIVTSDPRSISYAPVKNAKDPNAVEVKGSLFKQSTDGFGATSFLEIAHPGNLVSGDSYWLSDADKRLIPELRKAILKVDFKAPVQVPVELEYQTRTSAKN